MTVPSTTAFLLCNGCQKYLPVETMREVVGGKKRKLRYCPKCWDRRVKAMAAVKKGVDS